MKKLFFLMAFFLTACGAYTPTVMPTPTPNAGDLAFAMLQKQMEANATAQSVGLQFTATAQVIGATATANQLIVEAQRTEQARNDAIATSEQKRTDAQATQIRNDIIATAAREQVIADSMTEQARIDAIATQSSLSTATFTIMTLTAIPPHATLTQMAVNNQMAINTQEVERSALGLKQQRDTNVIQWLIPMLIAISLTVVGGFYIYNQSRIREIRDDDGKFQVFIMDNKLATKPALWTGPVLDLQKQTMPQLSAPAEQSEVTRRAQAIEALAAMPVQPTASGAGAYNDAFSPPRKRDDAFEIIEGDEVPVNLLDGETLKVLDRDWKEAHEQS